MWEVSRGRLGRWLFPLAALLIASCGGERAAGGASSAASAGMHAHGTVRVEPSESARMICGPEVARSIALALGLAAPPQGAATWNADRVYTCAYALPAGTLTVAVQELRDGAAAAQRLDGLRREQRTEPIVGLAALGLPAYRGDGSVLFAKDHMTLLVDASALPGALGSHGVSRDDFAYQIATNILACWTGK